MVEEIQTINVKEFGEEIVDDCVSKHGEDLNIDDIYEAITLALHDGIKADIAYFAFKYIDEKDIPCGD